MVGIELKRPPKRGDRLADTRLAKLRRTPRILNIGVLDVFDRMVENGQGTIALALVCQRDRQCQPRLSEFRLNRERAFEVRDLRPRRTCRP